MFKKRFSKESAYGYQHKNTKSSATEKGISTIPLKWILIGCVLFLLVVGGSYVGVYFLQSSTLQNTNEEIRNMDISVTGVEKTKADWEKSISPIIETDDTTLNKYSQLVDVAITYKVTEREYKRFKEDILNSYELGEYLVFDEQQNIANLFKSFVLNEYTSAKTDLQFKLFISNYKDALSYVYRDYEAADSEFVKGKEVIMDSALEKMKSE